MTQTANELILKMPIYAKFLVSCAWLIDPGVKTLEAFQLEDGFWKLIGVFAENDRVSIAPFDEIEIELSELWV